MLNFCSIVVAILKMETGRNFSMSGINSGHHNLPTYEISLKSNNVEFVRYCGRPVEIFRCQQSIWDIIFYLHMKCRWNQTLLNLCGIVAAILKMTTGKKFSMFGIISGHHYLPTYQILMISDNVEFLQPFWKWWPLEIFQCRESIRDIIIYPHIKFWWYRTMLNFCGYFENGDR